jgi:hypothetical protein
MPPPHVRLKRLAEVTFPYGSFSSHYAPLQTGVTGLPRETHFQVMAEALSQLTINKRPLAAPPWGFHGPSRRFWLMITNLIFYCVKNVSIWTRLLLLCVSI